MEHCRYFHKRLGEKEISYKTVPPHKLYLKRFSMWLIYTNPLVGGSELKIINHATMHRWEQNLPSLYNLKHWPGACLPGSRLLHYQPTCSNFSCHAGCNIREHGACYQPMSRGGGKPISASSITQLSSHKSRYILTKFRFHRYVSTWFIIINSWPPSNESPCI
jgi:hypothetical protein